MEFNLQAPAEGTTASFRIEWGGTWLQIAEGSVTCSGNVNVEVMSDGRLLVTKP